MSSRNLQLLTMSVVVMLMRGADWISQLQIDIIRPINIFEDQAVQEKAYIFSGL